MNLQRCVTGFALAAALLAVAPARAVEAVNVRVDVSAIDLTAATTLQKADGDRIQVSTAPGPDGIVRRIEVRAHLVPAAEREATWIKLEANWPGYRGYERTAGRELRIFRLSPR